MTITTGDLTTTAAKHVVKAIREGLGVNAADANSILLCCMWHMPCVEKGEDLRGIEARVRPGTSLGTKDACFDLFLNGSWKGAYRTGHVATKRLGYVDEAYDDAMKMAVRGEIASITASAAPARIDYHKQREERIAAGRAGEIMGVITAYEQHPMDLGCVRIDMRADDGETYVLAVVPIMGNSPAGTLSMVREKVGARYRVLWVRAPEFCADYDIGSIRTEEMGDEMVVDFFFEAPAARMAA